MKSKRSCSKVRKSHLQVKSAKKQEPIVVGYRSLKPEYQVIFERCSRSLKFGAGESIFREGGRAKKFFLIRKGSVTLEMGVPGRGQVTIQTLREGDALGFSWFYPPYRWHFGARAIQPTELLSFDAAQLRTEALRNPRFGYDLAYRVGELMLKRLQATRLQLMDFYGPGS